MIQYLFETSVTMKEYNRDKWWIDSDIIRSFHVNANNIDEALNKFVDYVTNDCYVDISNNAIKSKTPMYSDRDNPPVQVGYVITGSADFQNDCGDWSKQYVDIWVEVMTVVDTVFD